ncbi:MAG: low affinity iron permease family protein [Candidatus Eremiobacteraeota bacterium]|nr:low affinity iron permease family protein [Candidatus Eremiobacteraeota bacterium]
MNILRDQFGNFARFVNLFASSPTATALAFALVVLWALSGPHFRYSDFWQLIMNTTSSIITFLMVFVLNNAQSRDTSAINAKLDAIVYAMENTDNRLIGLEQQTESEAQAVMEDIKASISDAGEAVGRAEGAAGQAGTALRDAEDALRNAK